MTDPERTYVDVTVELEPDVRLLPGTILEGRTVIGAGAVIGPDTHLVDTIVGERATVSRTVAREAEIGDEAMVGPYSHLRPGTRLGAARKIGNFVEIKNSDIGEGAKVPHLSYVGDADIGPGANIGAGTITANYDGRHKHRTKIGAGRADRLEQHPCRAGRDRRRRVHRGRRRREPRRAARGARQGRSGEGRRGVGGGARRR